MVGAARGEIAACVRTEREEPVRTLAQAISIADAAMTKVAARADGTSGRRRAGLFMAHLHARCMSRLYPASTRPQGGHAALLTNSAWSELAHTLLPGSLIVDREQRHVPLKNGRYVSVTVERRIL